jgi:DNA-binding transcriptional LysR family regulator
VLNRLKLRPLLVFDRVLRCQSIARAARELNLTQPAVTKAIRELEVQLDTELFRRSNNRGVSPTEYGLLLGERVKSVIAELRYLTDELNTFKGGISGHVVVGTQISASSSLLPRAILQLKAQAPRLLITVREGPQDYLFPPWPPASWTWWWDGCRTLTIRLPASCRYATRPCTATACASWRAAVTRCWPPVH